MNERWFALGLDGRLYDCGSHPDFDSAEDWCVKHINTAIWIFDEKAAGDMEFILRTGLHDEERQRETNSAIDYLLQPPGGSDRGRGYVHDPMDTTYLKNRRDTDQ